MGFQLKILRRDRSVRGGSSPLLYVWLLGLVLRTLHLVLSSDNPLLYMPVLDEKYYVDMGKIISAGH